MSATVAVDANGADLGPAEVAAGAALAASRGVRVLLFGPAAEVGELPEGVELRDAPLSIAKEPDPARAVRSRPEASIVQAARAVASGEADALVSGGSTGAALATGLFEIKRVGGIRRPALALPIPIPGSPVLLLDVGANVEARAEHLVQFAFMGEAFARTVLGIAEPRVALLANGEEREKGTEALIAARTTLEDVGERIRFTGYVEGTGLASGAADVVVTDGFTGNVALKLMEGLAGTLLGAVREAAGSSARARTGGLLLRPALRGLRDQIDPETHGGAYLLGLRRVAVVCHGRFSRVGFANAIELAARGVEQDVVGRTRAALEHAGVLRGTPLALSDPTSSVPGDE